MSDTGIEFRAETCRSGRIVDGTIEELTCTVSVLNVAGRVVDSRNVSFTRYGSEFHWNWTETSDDNDAHGTQCFRVTQEACAHVDANFRPDVVAEGIAGWNRPSE